MPGAASIADSRAFSGSGGAERMSGGHVEIIVGDALEELRKLPSDSALDQYERRLSIPWAWQVFENVVRNDMPAGKSATHLAANSAQQQAHAKSCVAFVATLIAQWNGYSTVALAAPSPRPWPGGSAWSGGGGTRAAIEAEVDRLIAILDWLDGDRDLEPEDCRGECPDDVGEREGETWLSAA
ncbi:MAG TPA: hypothetical protein VFW19_10725 [Allosphingosinicella sp.]|nr:hypothetical protein [Allosphingosinicella sp.]